MYQEYSMQPPAYSIAQNQLLVVDLSRSMAGLLTHRFQNPAAFPFPVTKGLSPLTPDFSAHSDKFVQDFHLFPFSSVVLIPIDSIQFDILYIRIIAQFFLL